MNAALKAKAEKSLDMTVRYTEGIMSRREWLTLMRSQGATVKTVMKSKTQYNRIKYNRMNAQEQAEYERKLAEKIECYELHTAGSGFYDILKCEYDYFNSL